MRIRPAPALEGIRPYAVARHAAPMDLFLDGNVGAPPPRELVADFARKDPGLIVHYPTTRALEAVLAGRFGVAEDRVLVTSGSDDALDRACRALLGPERELVLPAPTFEMLPRYAALVGAPIREVAWWHGAYPLEGVLHTISPKTAAIAVVSPNNPTGLVATETDLRALAKAAPGVALFVDLAYTEFADDDLTACALKLENAIVFRTLSKAWGLAGLRVGFAIARPEIITWMRAAGPPYGVSAPSIAMALDRLATAQDEVREFAQKVRRERQRLTEALTTLGAGPIASQANFVTSRPHAALWLRDGMAGLGIAVRAWPDHPELKDAIRIACPGDEEQFLRLEHALNTVLAPEALIFDMDGVLADVSGSYRQAIMMTAASFGVTLSRSEIQLAKTRAGVNDDWKLTWTLIREHGVNAELGEVTARFEELYQGTESEPGLRCSEKLLGSRPLFERLAKRLRLGIVTGRPRRDAVRFLEEQAIADLFGVIVSMEDGPAKPDPAGVKLALFRLGVTRAWMIGDTPDDITAARRAGVVPLGALPPGETAPEIASALTRSGAARVLTCVDNLEELLTCG